MMRPPLLLIAPALAVLGLGGCGEAMHETGTSGGARMSMKISSDAFADGQAIPRRHTGDGEDVSPPLEWSGAPAGVRSFALVCDDPDAPGRQPWVHWVIYAIPGETRALAEGIPPLPAPDAPPGARQGRNSWTSGRTIGYRGPAPPPGHGVHHYQFRLYALDAEIDLAPGAEKSALLAAIKGHVLAEGLLVGTYQR